RGLLGNADPAVRGPTSFVGYLDLRRGIREPSDAAFMRMLVVTAGGIGLWAWARPPHLHLQRPAPLPEAARCRCLSMALRHSNERMTGKFVKQLIQRERNTEEFHVEDKHHRAIRTKGSVHQRWHGVHCYRAPGTSGV